MNDIKVYDIFDDKIVYEAILNKSGVPTIPDELVKQAEEIAKEFGFKVVSYEDNFDYIYVKVNDYFTKDNAEHIMIYYG